MVFLQRLIRSGVARNAASSYFSFFSVAISGFLSIPVAVKYLSKDQLGLWTICSSLLSYLLWMDLGVGSATGRKMADAVTAGHQEEIDAWWTTTRAVLMVQGFVVMGIGLAFTPLVLGAFPLDPTLRSDAIPLLIGSVILTGFSLPLRGVPGLMTAQDRFFWIPIGQGITPWIQLTAFWAMLSMGWGLKSYLFSMAAVQGFTWIYYTCLVRTSPHPPHWKSSGLTKERLKSLFSFSLSISLLGIIEAILTSLPALLLARLNALAMVPVYSITSRAPLLIVGLVRRTYHAFYPQMMRLHVSGQQEAFKRKHGLVGSLMTGVGLIAAGGILIFNRTIVEFLAGPDFFAGMETTTWFALTALMVPICALFESLLQFSGSMGKSPLLAILKLVAGGFGAYFGYLHFGMPGLAAVFALVPLINATYGYFRGGTGCGFQPGSLSLSVVGLASAAALLILLAGYLIPHYGGPGYAFQFHARSVSLPSIGQILIGGAVGLAGALLAARALAKIKA
jgi:O-antigen/teichoic acid export membrane protein